MYFYFKFDTYEMHNKVNQPKKLPLSRDLRVQIFLYSLCTSKKIRNSLFDMLNNLNKMGNFYRVYANHLPAGVTKKHYLHIYHCLI